MPAKSLKAADKQTILKKLTTEMKRRYGGSLPKQNWTNFETLLFAACLEDTGYQTAEAAYARLHDAFFDLNEIRVSSVTEVQQALGDVIDADWKAMRIREALQHIFEKHYAFDLEFLNRKTQEQAVKELAQIPHQSAFIRAFVVQQALGAHVIPVDGTMLRLLVWLGLVSADSDEESASDELKAGIKKTDAPLLCYLLKCTATDAELIEHFADGPDDNVDPMSASSRLAELFKNPKKKRKPAKPAATKAVSVKKPVKKTSGRPSAPAKSSPAPANRKVTKKVPPAKKTSRPRSK
jgi:endonuclease-3